MNHRSITVYHASSVVCVTVVWPPGHKVKPGKMAPSKISSSRLQAAGSSSRLKAAGSSSRLQDAGSSRLQATEARSRSRLWASGPSSIYNW